MRTGRRYSIGVIGHTGTVGAAVYTYFKAQHFSVSGYSRHTVSHESSATFEKINTSCDVIFICVPTPLDKKTHLLDVSALEDVLSRLGAGKIVVIKSTLLPGTTQALQHTYSALKILYNPEFLSRATAYADFIHPDRQLMGYTDSSRKYAHRILDILPSSGHSKVLTAVEAEIIKLAHNTYGAMSIMYANYLFDVCEKTGADYEHVKKGFSASQYVQKGILRYMTVYHNNKRGYGGACFPKDVKSFKKFCQTQGINTELIHAVEKANRNTLAAQGLTESDVREK